MINLEKCTCVRSHAFLRLRSKSRRAFASATAEPRYAPDLPFRMDHLILDVEIDPAAPGARGSVTHRLRVVDPAQSVITLDQSGLEIRGAWIGGKPVEFRKEDEKLHVAAPAGLAAGMAIELKVDFAAIAPRRGLYFTGPDAHFPDKPHQIWSQGQDQDNHYWFPTFDYPNQRTTVEVIATVPSGYTALSNGTLVSSKDSRFHYSMKQPIVVYLLTLVVGKFVGWKDQGPRGLPIEYYVAPGREEEGKRSFSKTPQMIEAFEKKIGVPFPYDKYSQVAVQDFIFGGMENASATTQTDLTLHDARAALDFSSDPLVSHELAHQWFGDLLTCKDWSHAWLNEGFATFMERVWVECDTGPDGGKEEAKYYAYQELKDYLDEDSGQYRRSIVCNVYAEPIDLFDRHLYQKGGLVLNLVRAVLGEPEFWQCVRHYVERNQNRAVETIDLVRAIEEVTGRNLRRLFDQWVFSAGHPEFEVSYSWREDQKLAELVIEQKQTHGKPEVHENGFVTPVFHLPVWIELWGEKGERIRRRVELKEIKERVVVPCEFTPKMVRFDPDSTIPKTLKFTRSREMLVYQLRNDPDGMGRIDAAKELAKLSDREAVQALAQVVTGDAFWAVQGEAALSLSDIRLDIARDALIAALAKVSHPKARRSLVRAIGTFKDPVTAAALKKIATQDASYLVEAEATIKYTGAALAGVVSGDAAKLDPIEAFLLGQLKKPSYREIIRRSTYRALASLPGIERGERPRALDAMLEGSRSGSSVDSRIGAIYALGEVAGRATPPIAASVMKVLGELAEEANYFVRMVIIGSLESSGLSEAIGILHRIQSADPDGRVKRHAHWAVGTIQEGFSAPQSIGAMKKELETLQTDYQKLKSAVEDLRAAQAPPIKPSPKSP